MTRADATRDPRRTILPSLPQSSPDHSAQRPAESLSGSWGPVQAPAVWASRSQNQYTPQPQAKGDLFKGFQRRPFRELPLTTQAGDEIVSLADRDCGPEVEAHALMVAGGAGDFLEPVGDVRLRALIEFHVRIHREAVVAAFADAPPFAVRLHESLVDTERTLLADGALDRAEPSFDLLNGWSSHGWFPVDTCRQYIGLLPWTATATPAE